MNDTPYAKAWKKFTQNNLTIFDPTNMGRTVEDRQKYLSNRIRQAFDQGWSAGLVYSSKEPTCKACGKPWPDYMTAKGPHKCSQSDAGAVE